MTRERRTPFSAAERLRAIATAIESGRPLTAIAAEFRCTIRALHSVITPKRSLQRQSEVISPDALQKATDMIRDGETFAATANALGVPTSTLTTTMHKHGLTARNLRQGSPRLREQFENAVLYYREGLKVAEIIRKTGIPERTFYILLGKQGVPLRQRRQSKGSAEISSQSARLAGPVLHGMDRQRGGFALAPILYMLGLIGVGAAVLFSGYSQILHTNVNVTNNLGAKNDLEANATTMAATSVLSTDTTLLCPPALAPTGECAAASVKIAAFGGQAQLPANTGALASTGNPKEVGVFMPGSGLKQLDPYGHFYVVCRWENPTNPGSGPAFMIISAGPDGALQTKCGDTTAQGDDLIIEWPVSMAINRSAVWQATINGSGNTTSVQFGQVGSQLVVDSSGDLTVPGTLNVSSLSTLSSLGTTGSATVGGSLGVNGSANVGSLGVSSGATVGGSLGVGGEATVGSESVAGNSSIGGTLGVSGAATFGSESVTGNSNIGGTLGVGGAATLGSLAVTSNAAVGGTLGVTGDITGGGALNVSGLATLGSESVTSNSSVGGTFSSGGLATLSSLSVTNNTTLHGTLAVTGTSAFTGNMTGSNANFSGTITAANFSGSVSGGSITWGSTIVPLANGGTGYAASSQLDLLTYLGGTNAGNLSSGTLPSGRIAAGEITSAMMAPADSGSSVGPYYQVFVDSAGRVTSGSSAIPTPAAIADGAGEGITADASGLTFTTGNVNRAIITTAGLIGIGTMTPTVSLDLSKETDALALPSGTTAQRPAAPVNGDIRYNTTAGITDVETYINGAWASILTSGGTGGVITSGVMLGTSAAATNPQRNGDVATGFYSPAVGTVAVAAGGKEVEQWNALTNAADYLSVTPGLSGTPPVIAVAGSTVNQNLNLTPAGTGSINLTSGPLLMAGVNGLWQDTANFNTAVGDTALPSTLLSGGQYDTAVGYAALNANTTGVANTALGYMSLAANTSGQQNTAVGYAALYTNAGGVGNTALGYSSLSVSTGGNYNTAIGTNVLNSNTTGANNTGVGEAALYKNTIGTNNTVLGYQVGSTILATGSSNVLIGTSAAVDTPASSTNNFLNIGNLLQGDMSYSTALGTEALYLQSVSGSVDYLQIAGGAAGNVTQSAQGADSDISMTLAPKGNGVVTLNAVTALGLPAGSTAQRPGAPAEGDIRYNTDSTPAVEAYINGSWTSFLTSSGEGGVTINLGTTSSTTNPQRNGQAGTGFYTAGSNLVDVAAGGTQIMEWSGAGENIAVPGGGLAITSTAFGSQNAVWLPPDPTGFGLALGQNVLVSDTTGTADQLADSDSGEYNTGVGQEALYKNTGGAFNTAVGAASLQYTTIGEFNTALGYNTLNAVTTGTNNTALGADVGSATLATGTNNILIGTSNAVDTPTASTSNFLNIGNTIFATGTNAGTVSAPAGDVGIGSTSPVASLDISQKTDAVALPAGTIGQRPTGVNGMIRYDSSGTPALEAYVNGAWESLLTATGGTSTLTLGVSASATNPQRSGQAGTGFYSNTSNEVEVAINGTNLVTWSASAENISGTITQGSYSIGYQINGNNAVWQDVTHGNLAVGATAFPTTISQSGAGSNGQDNVAVGVSALNANTTGYANTAVGALAGAHLTAGNNNTAIGTSAGWALTTSTGNTYVGSLAGQVAGNNNNTAIGNWALNDNSGANNVAIGTYALDDNTSLTVGGTGNNNVAVGYQALSSASSGPNTGIGAGAGDFITSGNNNTAVGTGALTGIFGAPLTGSFNTGVGDSALHALQGAGANNTTLGYKAGYAVTTGTDNTLVGYESGLGVTGNSNIIIGEDPSSAITSGGSNILVGNSLGGLTNSSSSQLNIGNILQGNMANSTATYNATLYLSSTASGVDYLQIAGGASGSPGVVTISGQGTDTNISMELLPKGTGGVGIGTATPVNKLEVNDTSGSSDQQMQITANSSHTAQLALKGVNTKLTMFGNNEVGNQYFTLSLDSAAANNMVSFQDSAFGNTWGVLNNSNGTWGFGPGNTSPTGTVEVYNATASTGATQLLVQGGAAAGDAGTNQLFRINQGGGTTGLLVVQGNGNVGIGTTAPSTLLQVNGAETLGLAGTTKGTLAFAGNTSGTVTLQPAAAAGTWSMTLPTGAGTSGFILQTDGSGITSWVAAGTGATITLGTSASVTNPQRSGDATTGLFSATVGTVSVSSAGTDVGDFASTGLNLPGTGTSYKLNGNNAMWQDNTNFNTAVGDTAFPTTVSQTGGGTNGQRNAALGYAALNANTTGAQNAALGYLALNVNTTGSSNTAVGAQALLKNTTGASNTAVGTLALLLNTTGANNTGVGVDALQLNTTGQYNTALGSGALAANTTGLSNTAVGYLALTSNTTTGANTALGYEALYLNTTGQQNTGLGYAALLNNTTGSSNTAVGEQALFVNTTGAMNTVIGYQVASTTLTTGTNNILIGTSSAVTTAAAGTNYNLNIGNLLQGDMTNSTALGTEALFLSSTASSVDYLQIAGGASGSPGTVAISGQGTDSNVSINVTPKGTGSTNFTAGNVGIGNTSSGALLDIGSAGTTLGTMRLEGNTSGFVQLQTAAAAGSWTMTLPVWAGTNGYCLTTDGSGNTTWTACVSALSTIDLGTSASATNPHRASDATTGLFSATVGTVSVAANGVDSMDFSSTGVNLSTLGEGYSINSAAFGSQNVVWIPPASADPTNFSLALGQNTLVSDNHGTTDQLADSDNGEYNTGVGQEALFDNTGGAYNTAVGAAALQTNNIGEYNTALGYNTLNAVTTGTNNTAIGADVGSATLQTGSGNILIGTSSVVDTPAAGTNDFLNIGNVIFATGMTGSLSSPAGKVGIGTASPAANLHIYQNANADVYQTIQNAKSGYNSYLDIISTQGGGYGNSFLQINGTSQVWRSGIFGTALSDANFAIKDHSNTTYPFQIEPAAPTGALYVKSTGNVGIANTSPGAKLDIGSAGTTLGTMRLEGNTSGFVQLQTAAAAGSWTMTLPVWAGTNGYCLTTDGSGNTTWTACVSALSTIDLGTSASATNPHRASDATTGLFSATVGTVSVAANGVDSMDFSSTGVNLSTLGEGYSINSAAFGSQNVVWIPPASADPTNFSLALGQNTLVSDNHGTTDQLADSDNGEYNTGVGQEALFDNTGGAYNTAVGAAALQTNNIGEYNTALGYNTLNAVTTGTNNTAIGADVGSATLQTGSGNILIGTSSVVDTPAAGTNDFLNIGNVIFATGMTGSLSSPAGKVGIGTASPAANLHIYQNANADVYQTIQNAKSGYNSYLDIISTQGGGYGNSFLQINGTSQVWRSGIFGTALSDANFAIKDHSNTTYPFQIEPAAPTGALYVKSTGNVGIGNTSPGAKLDIGSAGGTLGTMRLEGNTSGYVQLQPAAAAGSWTMTLPTSAGTSGYCLTTDGSGNTTWTACVAGTSTINLGTAASATNPSRSGDVTTGLFSATTGTVSVAAAGTDEADFASAGLNLPVATESYKIGGNNAVWQDATNFNLAAGSTAFPTTVSQSGGGSNGQGNTAVGNSALNANTTGKYNTAVGYDALQINTTGGSNTAVGISALSSNSTGAQNTAMGRGSLAANTAGTSNTALGYGALGVNTTGTSNTVIGINVASTTLTTGANNILIGTSNAVTTTAAGTNYNLNIGNLLQGDMTNSTALGAEALYLQSTSSSVNYLQIAGAATTAAPVLSAQGTDSNVSISVTPKGTGSTNFTAGNVGIGTTAPDASLQIGTNGLGIDIGDGTVAANYIHFSGSRGIVGVSNGANVILAGGSGKGVQLQVNSSSGVIGTGTVAVQINSTGLVGIGNISPGALLDIGNAGTTLGTMRLEGNTSGYVQLQPPAAAGSWTMTLPSSGGTSGYVLSTDGSGNTSWVSQTSGASGITLGTSAAATNPTRSGEVDTGLFSATTGTVSVAVNIAGTGTDEADFASTGLNLPVATESYKLTGINAIWQDNTNFNTAVGDTAMPTTVAQGGTHYGQGNVAVGYQALNANTTGYYNTATGATALAANTTGQYNTAMGYAALAANTTGQYNTAVGRLALNATTTGTANTAVGAGALYSNTTAQYNTAMGYAALYNNTTGQQNTAVGMQALEYNSTGTGNTALGFQAMLGITGAQLTGSYNTGIGDSALYAMQDAGANNTTLGYKAGYAVTTGTDNTLVGYESGLGVTGNGNIIIGEDANSVITSGSNNIVIGQNLQELTNTSSNQLDIGNLIFATGLSSGSTMSTGSVGIGNTSPGAKLDVGLAGTTLGTMRLEGNTSGYVQLQPAAAAGSWTMTLPTSAGTSGYCLTTDGSGNTTWSACVSALSTIDLGTSAGATNPQRNGDATTGLFSPATDTVAIAEGGTQQLTVNNTGVGIGTTSINGLLDVGSGTPTTAANGIYFGSDTSADLYRAASAQIDTDGSLYAAVAVSAGIVTLHAGSEDIRNSSSTVSLGVDGSVTTTAAYQVVIGGQTTQSYTSGDGGAIGIRSNTDYAPTSGTGTYEFLSLNTNGVINQTSTATGVTRGLYVSPTLTSAYDFRGIETAGYTQNLLGTPPTTIQQVLFNAPTLAAGSSETVTNAATEIISGAPVAGTNVTITNPYALWVKGGTTLFGGAVTIGSTTPVAGGGLTIAPSASTSGTPSLLTITGPADTTLAASTEVNDVNINLARTVQFATGALTNQRAVYIQAPTYGFVAASTITNAATVDISGPPVAGTHATITNAASFVVESGNTGLGTKAPANVLDVNGSLAVGTYAGTATGASNELIVGGNVGIGTATPGYALSVTGDTYASKGLGVGTAPAGPTGTIRATGNTGSPLLLLSQNDGTNNATLSMTPVNATNNSRILANWTAGGGYLGLGAGNNDQVVINQGGNVGIGSTSPVASLDISQKTDAVALPAGTIGQRPTGVNGMIRYDSSGTPALEAYVNGAWESLLTATGGTSTLTLGVSASATNPQRSGQAGTGFYSNTSNEVEVAINGTNLVTWSASAENISGTITQGSYSIGYQINGNNAVWQDVTHGNLAVGATAFPTTISQSGAGSNGQDNVAVGVSALNANTTGYANTAVGALAGAHLTAGNNNTAIGTSAGWALTTSTGNTYVGSLAGQVAGNNNNTAIGNWALNDNSGANNVAIGTYALDDNTSLTVGGTGNNNVAVGYQALSSASSGPNTGIGAGAGDFITSGNNNTAVGTGALTGIFGAPLTGSFNTGVGDSALHALQGAGANNTTLGYKAGYAVTTGTDNTLVGYESGLGVTGNSNIIIGEDPSSAITSGGSNILVGNSLGGLTNSSSSQLNIGNILQGNMANSTATYNATLYLSSTASGVDYLQIAGGASGSPGVVTISGQGTDTNISMELLPKGTGGVGIGTATPVNKLEVNDTSGSSDQQMQITANSSHTAQLALKGVNTKLTMFGNNEVGNQYFTLSLDSAAANNMVSFQDSAFGNTWGVLNNSNGTWGFGPGNTSPTGTVEVYNATASTGATQLLVQGGAAAGDAGTNQLFRINQGGGTTGLLVVQGNGNVGIGTTAPQATLDVNGYARLALNSSAPVACSSSNPGAIALNHLAKMCACNGTNWNFADSAGAACSW